MRKWILAALTALAVGQADARTMSLVMAGDFSANGPATHQATDFWVSILYDLDKGMLLQGGDYTMWTGAGVSMGPIQSVRFKIGDLSGTIRPVNPNFASSDGYLEQLSPGSTVPVEVAGMASFFGGGGNILTETFSYRLLDDVLRGFDYAQPISVTGLSGDLAVYGIDITKPQWVDPIFAEFNILVDGHISNVELSISPVPLPASAPLMLAGLIGLGVIRRAGSRSAT